MNRLPFITLLIMLLSAACGHDSRLDTAAALMYPAPDSAMALLDSIDPASLHGEHEHARYALLYSQAQNKNHIFPTSDSLINIAVSYYDHSGHDSLRMLAHFYRSVIYNSASAHHSALRDALLAKDLAECLHQPYWVARASQEIADAYYQSYDMDNSIRYSDIAARNFTRTGYHLNSHYVTVDKAAALNYRGHYNESLRILDSLANVIDTTDYNICAYLWNVRIKPLNALGRHNEAFTYAYKSISTTPLIIEPIFQYCDIANLHTTIGQLDSAAYYLDKGRAQDSMTYFYSNSYYLENKGDYQGALKSFRSYFKIRNKLLNDLINDNISVEEKEFISNKAGIDAKVQRRKTMIITCCSVTLMLILALLILYMRAQYRIRQIESDRKLSDALDAMTELSGDNISLLARLSSASDTIACQNTARQQLAHTIQKLLITQFSKANEVYENYLESKANQNITKKSILARKIENQLAEITSPDSLQLMQAAINLYQDNVLVRISEQTKLTSDDLTFLTLYMTGLSARTICVILDIKQSTYYSHRRRIREKIKCSEAPDATEFLALLGIMD